MKRAALALLTLALTLPDGARAQQPIDDPPNIEQIRVPAVELAPAARQRIGAAFLSEDERRALRVFHGVWEDGDLDGPVHRAAAALVLGVYDDPALADDAVAPEIRAEAAVRRGDADAALTMLTGVASATGIRVRAEALMALGRFDDADAAIEPLVDRLAAREATALELTEGVRALRIRTRMKGPQLADGGDYRQMLALLGRAQQALDPMDWRVRLTQAQLLYDKHNRAEAQQAAGEALGLNPNCADAWAIIGRLAVDGFDFQTARQIARKLDTLAGRDGPMGALLDDHFRGSADAALIRTRARIRQRDADGALEEIDPALARYPAHRGALALEAAAAAIDFRQTSVERLAARFDALAPGSPDLWHAVGAALSEARQYEDASAALRRAIDRMPTWSKPWIELGLMELQAGRDGEALNALERAIALDPFNSRARNSLTMVAELLTWEQLESEHFVVRHRGGVHAVLAEEMLPILERIHDRVTGAADGGIDHEPVRKTQIELMPSHEWFAVRITGMPAIHTMAASTGPVVAMEAPAEGPGFRIGPYDWPRVVQHEYTHTVTLSRTRNRIPHWFTEAAAVFMEDGPRSPRSWQLLANAYRNGQLFSLEEINIAFVRPRLPTDRAQAYAQGHWMYEYIVEAYGDRAPLELMDRYASGMSEGEAFEEVLGIRQAEFLPAFRLWARAQLTDVGLLPAEGDPALAQLLESLGGPEDASPLDVERAQVEAWLGQHPRHPDLLELLVAKALQDANRALTPELIALLERYIDARPIDDMPHRLLARHHLESDDRGTRHRAIAHLEFLDAREQHSPAYAAELARLYAERGEHERAIDKGLRATRIAPYDADMRELCARVAIVGDRLDVARHQLTALSRLEPDRELHRRRLAALEGMGGKRRSD